MLTSIHNELRQLEERLLDSAVRNDRDQVAALLTDDFIEFGGSGRIFDKSMIIDAIGGEAYVVRNATDFHVELMGPDIALVTYRLSRADGSTASSLRSSLWKRSVRGWQLRFHQGTPVADGAR